MNSLQFRVVSVAVVGKINISIMKAYL